MIRNLSIETLKMCGGLTFGTKAPGGATFSPLAVPAQDVLYRRFLSSPRVRVASRWALVMLILSPSTAPKSLRGSSRFETNANDDVTFDCASEPLSLLAAPTPSCPSCRFSCFPI